MKRFSAVLMTCLLVMFFAVATNVHVASSKEPKLPFTKAEIIKAYDDVMEQIGDVRPLAAAKEEKTNSKYSDTYFYTLTSHVAVMLEHNKGGTYVTHAKAIGVEDGTAETKALIVLNNMALLAALTPAWNGDLRGAIGKDLGLTGVFPVKGKANELSANGDKERFKLTFANNGERGLTFTFQAEESVRPAPAKPNAPAKKASPPPAKRQEAPKRPQPEPEPSGLSNIRS